MSHGVENIKGEITPFGFFSVKDWLESVILSFPAPWSIAPLHGKYYGTLILDARSVKILKFWDSNGDPSEREKAEWKHWTLEEWNAEVCDSHWESAATLERCRAVVALRNACAGRLFTTPDELLAVIVSEGCWDEAVWPEIACGGPKRRPLKPRPQAFGLR